MKCELKGCENEAVDHVWFRLPDDSENFVLVNEDVRNMRVNICEAHKRQIEDGAAKGMSMGFSVNPSGDDQRATGDSHNDEGRGR